MDLATIVAARVVTVVAIVAETAAVAASVGAVDAVAADAPLDQEVRPAAATCRHRNTLHLKAENSGPQILVVGSTSAASSPAALNRAVNNPAALTLAAPRAAALVP